MKWHICYHPTLVLKTPSCFRHMLLFLCEVETLKTEKQKFMGGMGPRRPSVAFHEGIRRRFVGGKIRGRLFIVTQYFFGNKRFFASDELPLHSYL